MTSRSSVLALAVALVSSSFFACGDDTGSPTLPSAAIHNESSDGRVSSLAAPLAVFKTSPEADAEGVILGGAAQKVEFNLCQSRPVNADDSLRYTFDFDSDGQIDAFGHCRAQHVYENPNGASSCVSARVCVSDRRSDGDVCRSYDVCLDGGAVTTEVPTEEEVPPSESNEEEAAALARR